MNIAVAGSKDFDSQEYLFETLDAHIGAMMDIVIISGSVKGVECFARQYKLNVNEALKP